MFTIPVSFFDAIVIQRLKSLIAADKEIKDKVRSTLELVHKQQGEDFVSIHEQLEGLEIQLKANARKIANENDEGLEKELRVKRAELLAIQAELEAKKEKLGIIDSPEEIERVHHLLGNFDKVWATLCIDQKQRALSLLISKIEITVVSPHWVRLSIDWLDSLCPRIDIALIWRITGTHGKPLNDQEAEIIKQHYPCSSRLEIQKLLPNRTWNAICRFASGENIERNIFSSWDNIPLNVCYRDFTPQLDGNYLFGDYETTLDYIKTACSNTSRCKAPLYPIWMPAKVEDLASLVEEDLDSGAKNCRVLLNRKGRLSLISMV